MAKIDFTPADWARIRNDYMAWWNGELDRPLVVLPSVTKDGKPRKANGHYGFTSPYPPEVTPEELDLVWLLHGGIFYQGIREHIYGLPGRIDIDRLAGTAIAMYLGAAPGTIAAATGATPAR